MSGRRRVHTFQSFGDLVAAGQKDAAKGYRSSREDDYGDEGWHGTRTYADALEMAREGWAEMRPLVERIADKVQPSIREYEQETVTWTYDVAGDFPDVGRYLEGDPECMLLPTMAPVARHGRVVTILIDMTVSASISPEEIRARGAAVVALIETLQMFGHTCDLWIEDTSSTKPSRRQGDEDDDRSTRLVRIKSPSEYIDADALMYVLAHPSVLRRHCFAQRETLGGWERFAGESGYGYPMNELTQGDTVGADVLINGPKHGDTAITDPVEWVKIALKGLGLLEEGDEG